MELEKQYMALADSYADLESEVDDLVADYDRLKIKYELSFCLNQVLILVVGILGLVAMVLLK